MVYQFRKGARIAGVKAQVVGETLEALRKKHGRLETTEVLQEAKKKRSPLHGAFEWDDAKAGHEYRLYQARSMIRGIVVVLEDGDEPAYVHVQVKNNGYYQSSSVACQNVDEWELVRRQVLGQLESASDSLDKLDQVAQRYGRKDRRKVSSAQKSVSDAVSSLEE